MRMASHMWLSIAVWKPGWRMPWWTTSKNPSGARSAARWPMAPPASDRRVIATLGEPIRATRCRSHGVESAVKNGSPCIPGSATAGTPTRPPR